MRKFLSVIFLGFSGIFAGCSTAVEEAPSAPPPDSIELYVARASLFKSPEFESYKLIGDRLYTECGAFSGGRHAVSDRAMLALSTEELTAVRNGAAKLSSQLSRRTLSLSEPGDGQGFADPGIFEVRLSDGKGPLEVKTSFDSVVNKEGTSERRLLAFAETVRRTAVSARNRNSGVSPIPCGNAQFFGLH